MKLSKPFKLIFLIFAVIVVFGFTFQKIGYIGEISCKAKRTTSIFGIVILSKEVSCEEADYLASLVGDIQELRYNVSARRSVIFGGGWVAGTPEGNWFWVHLLKNYEQKGLSHETAVEIAKGLISDDVNIRELAIEQIRNFHPQ